MACRKRSKFWNWSYAVSRITRTPERAIPSAQRLMGIVPAAGHIVHMPGHIWVLLGDFNTAAAVNERAAQVDREYFARTGIMGAYYPYYLHNLHFVLYARAMQGHFAETTAAAQEMARAVKPVMATMPEMADFFGGAIPMAQLRLYQWDAVLSVERPKAENPLAMSLWHYARAVAFAGKGQLNEARQEQTEFESLCKKVDRNAPWDTNKTGDVMELASAILKARVESSPSAAVQKWRRAVELQDSLAYGEPPAWYYPVRESLGAALLRAGDPAAAETVFREGLRRSPNNGRMLFGLLDSLKAQQKTDAAAWVQGEFDTAWKGADIKLRLEDF
jgi:tetratricopeptide (TPR) repeat protein